MLGDLPQLGSDAEIVDASGTRVVIPQWRFDVSAPPLAVRFGVRSPLLTERSIFYARLIRFVEGAITAEKP
jgi:hypothetical protein